MNQLYLIPNYNNIETSLKLASEYGAVFEYNDFYLPSMLDDDMQLNERIKFYQQLDRDRSKDTLHASFFDITLHSSDPKIREISEQRIYQCMDVADKLGILAIIIHTNCIANFNVPAYHKQWVDMNEAFVRKALIKYPNLNIYMENMFDTSPLLLSELAKRLKDCSRFGVCFDVAHANLSSLPMEEWVKSLLPFVRHLHLNDNKGDADTHDIPGTGNIDWQKMTSLFKETNISALLEISDVTAQKTALSVMKENMIFPLFI